MLHQDVSTPQGLELHPWTCLDNKTLLLLNVSTILYTGLCTWTYQHYSGLELHLACLHHRGLSYTWRVYTTEA